MVPVHVLQTSALVMMMMMMMSILKKTEDSEIRYDIADRISFSFEMHLMMRDTLDHSEVIWKNSFVKKTEN